MMIEFWVVHCLRTGNGRAYVGVANSIQSANLLVKEMKSKLGPDIAPEEFVVTRKKVKNLNIGEMRTKPKRVGIRDAYIVLDLT